jgi:hypothetical protein
MRDARSRLFVPETVGSTPTFNPADFGADFSWWAARLESYANGALVPTWTDRGSGTMTVTGAVGQEPEFRDGTDPVAPNGQPCVRWVSGDRLLNTVTGVTGPYTAAVVCRPTALGSTNNVPLIGGTAVNFTSGLKMGSGSGNLTILRTGNAIAISFNPGNPVGAGYNPISPLGWQVVVGTFHFGNANQGLAVFKSGLTAGSSPNNFISGSNTGGNNNSVAAGVFCVGGNLFVGEIAEAVLWRQTMDAAMRAAIGKQLSDLYGVTY